MNYIEKYIQRFLSIFPENVNEKILYSKEVIMLLKSEMILINELQLSSSIQELITEFNYVAKLNPDILDDRKNFLWNWLKIGNEITTLSFLDYSELIISNEIRSAQMIYAVLLDDIADRIHDKKLLNLAIQSSFFKKNLSMNDLPYERTILLKYIIKVFSFIESKLKLTPNYNLYRKDLRKYYKLFFQSLYFSIDITENPKLISMKSYQQMFSHNMHFYLSGTVDMSASDEKDIPKDLIYPVIKYTQQMARIGNWISTWKRELKDKDFSSGVYAYAVDKDILKANDLDAYSTSELTKMLQNSNFNEYMIEKWISLYAKASTRNLNINVKDKRYNLHNYIESFKVILLMHIGSEGLK